MSLYYCPEKGVLGDVIPFYDNGVFKPFYLVATIEETEMLIIRTVGLC